MAKFTELLGDTLVSGSAGETVQTSALGGHYVGLYFSASWCPPCQKFTPRLVTFYNKYQRENKEKKLEIVFVSADKTEEEFKRYYRSMPWKAVAFDSPLRTKISNSLKVEGLPTLVILDPNGAVLTKGGVNAVMSNDIGSLFPLPIWEQLAGTKVYDNKGVESQIENIIRDNDVIGFYFSASWCPPCRTFTPVLIEAYNKLRAEGKRLEIIFASSDKDQASYSAYFGKMPWKSLKFKSPMKEHLSARWEVEGIPTLVFLDKSGKTISKNGRNLVSEDLDSYPWTSKKALPKLSGSTAEFINDSPVCLVVTDGKEEAKLKEMLTPVAEEYVRKWEDKDPQPLYFLLVEQDPLANKLLAFLNVTSRPALVIANLPEGEKFLPAAGGEITVASFKSFVDSFLGDRAGLVKKGPRD
jgi:nucleoredoxin